MQDETDGPAGAALLDRAHLDRQTAGDAELAVELLALFADQCRRLLPAIADRSASKPDRADRAHTLKGSALGVGAARVADRVARIETSLRAGNSDIEAEMPALAEDIAATLAEIAKP